MQTASVAEISERRRRADARGHHHAVASDARITCDDPLCYERQCPRATTHYAMNASARIALPRRPAAWERGHRLLTMPPAHHSARAGTATNSTN